VRLIGVPYDLDVDPVSRAIELLTAANLMPPVTSLHQYGEESPVVVEGRDGLTSGEVTQIAAVLADVSHKIVSTPTPGGILYGGP
jgi:hypothetical protein